MQRIIFIAQFPPPIHGLSKAVDTLYNSRLKERYSFQTVNIMSNKRIVANIVNIISAKTDAFYFTISQSKGGLWRDAALMALMVLRRKPLIIHLHGGYLRTLIDAECGPLQRWLACKLIGKAAECVVLGDSLRYIFRGIVGEERIAVVPNCVDDEYLMGRDVLEDKMKGVAGAPVLHVLYLSNLIAAKGYREVLQTAKALKEQGLGGQFKFHFAGKFFEEAEQDFFETYISNNGLQKVVEYHGVVSGDSKRELLRQCNVFMLLTRYPNEGQPISILEAMGNGLAVVTTDHAGIPDIATAANGLVCPKADICIGDIMAYLSRCYEDRKYLVAVAQSNYKMVCSNYTQKKYVDNMEKVFSHVLKK